MKNRFVYIALMLLVLSCAEKLIEKPENLISEEQMVLILTEMAIVNAANGSSAVKLVENGVDPTTYVFEKFKIDSTQFVDSDRYYASRPLIYESLYQNTEVALDNLKKELELAKKEKDSLNRILQSKKEDLEDPKRTKKFPQ